MTYVGDVIELNLARRRPIWNALIPAKILADRILKVRVLDEVFAINIVLIGVNVKGEAHLCYEQEADPGYHFLLENQI